MPRLRLLLLLLHFVYHVLLSQAAQKIGRQSAQLPIPIPIPSNSNSAIIISTVDGVIYTLDAYNGNLRGMVQSGGSLISDPSANANTHHTHTNAIIPGLDGTLYSLTDKLRQLPVTIRDIIEQGPISTCIDNSHGDGDEGNHEICGLVMGQSSSKLIALDPIHGTVQWMHHTNTNFNTEFHNNSKKAKTKTVLLQREDYNIKHIDAESGLEAWKVHLGSIKALHVPKKKVKTKPINGLFRIRSGVEMEASYGLDGEKRDAGVHSTPLMFEQPFPSVAFGSDGLTLFCVDELENVLWERNFESVIASVYGVGGDMDWVDLQVLELDGGSDSDSDNAGKSEQISLQLFEYEEGGENARNEDDYGMAVQVPTPILASESEQIGRAHV